MNSKIWAANRIRVSNRGRIFFWINVCPKISNQDPFENFQSKLDYNFILCRKPQSTQSGWTVKVRANDLAWDFLLPDSGKYAISGQHRTFFSGQKIWFQSGTVYDNGQSQSGRSSLIDISPYIRCAQMEPSWNNRIRVKNFTNMSVYFLGISTRSMR